MFVISGTVANRWHLYQTFSVKCPSQMRSKLRNNTQKLPAHVEVLTRWLWPHWSFLSSIWIEKPLRLGSHIILRNSALMETYREDLSTVPNQGVSIPEAVLPRMRNHGHADEMWIHSVYLNASKILKTSSTSIQLVGEYVRNFLLSFGMKMRVRRKINSRNYSFETIVILSALPQRNQHTYELRSL